MEPEELWKGLLSGNEVLIRAAWKTLDGEERGIVRRHLQSMSGGKGWQASQHQAALAALRCLDENKED
jgi:hypothetical protein